MSSIVIDTCVLRLYDAPADPRYKNLFMWLRSKGTLYVSHKLINEYLGTNNRNITILLSELSRHADNNRLVKISKTEIEEFKDDRKYKYTCNVEDIYHSKLVFISPRKKLISQDKKIVADVNRFKKVAGIKPEAIAQPLPVFYE